MYKIMWLLKRKPGISHEQFRDHYENSHSLLGKKYLGHLLLSYERNYNGPRMQAGDQADLVDKVLAAKSFDYDVVTEWKLASRDAFLEAMRIVVDPEIGKIFYDDEEFFLDRDSVRLIECNVYDTGTA